MGIFRVCLEIKLLFTLKKGIGILLGLVCSSYKLYFLEKSKNNIVLTK